MNYLLNRGKEKILGCFYNHRNEEIYFRQLMAETGLTQNTTLKHLRSLNNFLSVRRSKAHTFYRIKNSEINYAILSYFDYKRYDALEAKSKRAIQTYIGCLKKKPLIAVIFGSASRLTKKQDSDIDILLIFNDKELKNTEDIENAEALTGKMLHPFFISYQQFKDIVLKKDDPVINQAINSGFVYLGHYYFYREVIR